MAIATDLSMLWESIDPEAALVDRFGFTGAGHACSWLADAVRSDWGCQMVRCDRLVISASNLLAWLTVDGDSVVAKCSVDRSRFARLAYVDALVSWLECRCIPVASPIAASDGRLRVERERLSIGVYPFRVGDLLDVGDAAQVEAAGRTLASLHDALAAYPFPLDGRRREPDQQLVHGDFRSANVLQVSGNITAILDFDDVSYRSRTTDLAQAAVLLGTRYHDWAATTPSARETFLRAYCDVAPLTARQQAQLDQSIAGVLSHFGWT